MSFDSLPKEFEKTTEVLPFSKYGLSTYEEFKKAEAELHVLEKFKIAGLTDLEIKLYQENEAGTLDCKKIESNVLKEKLKVIYDKIQKLYNSDVECDVIKDEIIDRPSTSKNVAIKPSFHPEGHPMNSIKQLEQNLFGHLHNKIPSFKKRRKMLRRLERRKERILSYDPLQISLNSTADNVKNQLGSKWDIKEICTEDKPTPIVKNQTYGPLPKDKHSMYTIRDGKIVKVESNTVKIQENHSNVMPQCENDSKTIQNLRKYCEETKQLTNQIENKQRHEIDSKVMENNCEKLQKQPQVQKSANDSKSLQRPADSQIDENQEALQQRIENLLEGTRMSMDDIMKIEEYKDYKPGIPSKILELRNISPSVSEEQLKLLFNQFILSNGGSVEVQLTRRRDACTATVHFRNEATAIQALEETNGTVVSGRPIVVNFKL